MIETKILGEASGVQYQGVRDLSETNQPPSLTSAVIIGRFKRGRTGVAFNVTKDNYQSMLGYDPSNPDFLAVEDVFGAGVSEITIVRVGKPLGK